MLHQFRAEEASPAGTREAAEQFMFGIGWAELFIIAVIIGVALLPVVAIVGLVVYLVRRNRSDE